jgi:hypothetical protein
MRTPKIAAIIALSTLILKAAQTTIDRMIMRRRHDSPFFVAFLLLLAVMPAGCKMNMETRIQKVKPEMAAKLIESEMDYFAGRLYIGMPKIEALKFLPAPHNTNTENVCIWVFEQPSGSNPNRLDWQWLQARAGFFVVFVSDKLATPVCATAAFDPWQALQTYAKVNDKRADEILGMK